LVKDDWLQVKKVGRKSYYSFTSSANNHYTKAARRIYAGSRSSISHGWLILVPSFVDESKLPVLKRQLKWLGFSSLTAGVFAHPNFEQQSLEETIDELSLSDSVIIFSSETIDQNSTEVLKRLVFEKWNLKSLQTEYISFIKSYQSISDNSISSLSNQQAFLLRGLLVHEYRRILLKDHELSKDMLPGNWKGNTASELVKDLYAQLSKKSCLYIVDKLESVDGFLPKASLDFKKRFH